MIFEIAADTRTQKDILESTDIRYFDKLINSIYMSDKYIHYLGRPKRLNQDDPFYTIMNEQTWNAAKKLKYEEYIIRRFGNIEKFNLWCKGNKLQLHLDDKKMLSFFDDENFNLVFVRNGIYLDCYGYDDKFYSKQVTFICNSSNKKMFEDSILSYLRYYSNLKSIVGISDHIVLKTLKAELNKGLLIEEGQIQQISNSSNKLCLAYYKLPNGKGRIGATPTWDQFLSQFKDWQIRIFRAWVYGVFVESDNNRQILWIEGDGHNGKSTVASVIGEELAAYNPYLFNAITIEKDTDKINLVDFDKCRFAVFSNVMRENSDLLSRQEILLLTGNDYTKVKKLYHDPENKKLFSKIMVNSNHPPKYNDKIAYEKTRMIYLKMDQELINKSKAELIESKIPLNQRLKKEFNNFMKRAYFDYKDLIQPNGLLKI